MLIVSISRTHLGEDRVELVSGAFHLDLRDSDIQVFDSRDTKPLPSNAVEPTKGNKMPHPYPSLFNNSNSPLKNAYLQSLEPLRARMHLISLSAMPGPTDRIALLAEDCVAQGVGIDEELDKGKGDVDRVMAKRVAQGKTEIDAYKLPDVKLTPQSTNPDDFAPFAGDTSTMPELWIQDPAGEGPSFNYGIDATAFAINGTGNPRCNPQRDGTGGQLTEFVSNTPGENGCIVRVDQFGFRVKPGETAKGEKRFRAVMQGRNWWFEAYEKGNPDE